MNISENTTGHVPNKTNRIEMQLLKAETHSCWAAQRLCPWPWGLKGEERVALCPRCQGTRACSPLNRWPDFPLPFNCVSRTAKHQHSSSKPTFCFVFSQMCVDTSGHASPQRPVQAKQSVFFLTFHREVHGLADVRAHVVADLAQVVATVFLHHVLDQQRPVAQHLNPAVQGDWLELGDPSPWNEIKKRNSDAHAKTRGEATSP